MKFFIRYSVLLLAFCVMIGHVSAGGDSVVDFQYIVNGVYINKQVIMDGADNTGYDEAILTFIPITVPILQSKVTYFEHILNDEVVRRELWTIFLINNKVNIVVYNFTSSVSNDFDLNDVVDNLKEEDLHGDKDCPATFTELSGGMFVGSKTDCRDSSNGYHPVFDGTATCNALIIGVPAEASRKHVRGSYVFTRDKDRFPIPDVPDGYEFPC